VTFLSPGTANYYLFEQSSINLIEQYFPHIVHTSERLGLLDKRYAFAFSGSIES